MRTFQAVFCIILELYERKYLSLYRSDVDIGNRCIFHFKTSKKAKNLVSLSFKEGATYIDKKKIVLRVVKKCFDMMIP